MESYRKPLLGILIVAALVAVWLVLGRHLGLVSFLDHRSILTRFVAQHQLLALLTFGLGYVAVVVFSLPVASLMTLLGGVLFGGFIGGTAAVLAATIGATLVFMAARSLLHDYFVRKSGPWLGKLRNGFQADAASYLLLLRLTPVFPFFVVNVAAALLGSRLGTFIWTTCLGIVPGTLAYAFVGAGLGNVLDFKADKLASCRATGRLDCTVSLDFSSLLSREMLFGFGGLALLVLVSLIVRKVLAKRSGGKVS